MIAADGVNSAIRTELAGAFGPSVDRRDRQYVWFATTRPFDCFTFQFVETPHGLFWAHIRPVRRRALHVHRRDRLEDVRAG
ncbi:hypothetical protein HBB16_10290 [Pseudonocardia sp. MCCB 268]|nr:hypothetical protein [Pseudonocardia cytotoxica]